MIEIGLKIIEKLQNLLTMKVFSIFGTSPPTHCIQISDRSVESIDESRADKKYRNYGEQTKTLAAAMPQNVFFSTEMFDSMKFRWYHANYIPGLALRMAYVFF